MNRTLAILATTALLAACNGSDDVNTDDNPADDSGCTNAFTTFPADGSNDAFYRTTIEVAFTTADESATVTVDDGAVSGSSAWDGTTLVFTPDAPLAAATTYTVDVAYCEGATTSTFSFTTSAVGSPTTTGDITKTYALDVGSGRFVKPEGIGSLVGQFLTFPILVAVTNATDTEVEMMDALGTETEPPAQDLCTETISFPEAADFSENPFFSIGPDSTTINVAGQSITIDDLEISGAFAADGSYIAGAVLAGAIDTRPLAGLVDEEGGDSAICDLAETFLISCEACSDGSGDFCLSLYVDNMTAEAVSGLELIPLTTEQVDADPNCQ